MTYEQPTLPYSETALEPVISAETIRYHYGKHEKAYIDNLNRLIKGTEYEDAELEDIIEEAIDRDFGSFDKFKDAFVEAGVGLFGSGWVWLSRDNDGKLLITQGSNAQNPLKDGLTPLLTFDVWEHAYYIDYKNLRADYLRQLWNIVDWDVVESRY